MGIIKSICLPYCLLLLKKKKEEWLDKVRRAIWQYIFEHSNYPWFIIGSRRASYSSHLYHFFHRGLGGKNSTVKITLKGYMLGGSLILIPMLFPQPLLHFSWGRKICMVFQITKELVYFLGSSSKRLWGKEGACCRWNH